MVVSSENDPHHQGRQGWQAELASSRPPTPVAQIPIVDNTGGDDTNVDGNSSDSLGHSVSPATPNPPTKKSRDRRAAASSGLQGHGRAPNDPVSKRGRQPPSGARSA